jgi:hypothetical protein
MIHMFLNLIISFKMIFFIYCWVSERNDTHALIIYVLDFNYDRIICQFLQVAPFKGKVLS